MKLLKKIILLTLVTALISAPALASAKTLIIFYSRTGITKTIAETIAKEIGADSVEIKETHSDRLGFWGFVGAGWDAFLDNHSEILPQKINLQEYDTVIIASPIWSWNFATPIHTLLQTHNFDHQKVILVTNANIDIKKYDQYKGGTGNAVQNFLEGYLKGKQKKARDEMIAATSNDPGRVRGHFHIETKNKIPEQLIEDAKRAVEYIKDHL
jgi:menaquinone-dependent protoporphyrinogen IX oxidase